MTPESVFFFILLPVLIVIMGITLGRRRRQMITTLARRLKLRFSPRDTLDFYSARSYLRIFAQGHAHRLSHVVYGRKSWGRTVMFDLRFETGFGMDRQVHRRQVVFCEWPCQRPCNPELAVVFRQPAHMEPPGCLGELTPLEPDATSPELQLLWFSDRPVVAAGLLSPALLDAVRKCGDVDGELYHDGLALYAHRWLNPLELTRLFRDAVRLQRLWRATCKRVLTPRALHQSD